MAAASYNAVGGTVVIQKPSEGREIRQIKTALLYTAATAAQGDTYTFDMSTLGGSTLLGLYTVYHDTANSVLAANAVTTTVSGTTITFTIPAAGGTKIRATKIYFE